MAAVAGMAADGGGGWGGPGIVFGFGPGWGWGGYPYSYYDDYYAGPPCGWAHVRVWRQWPLGLAPRLALLVNCNNCHAPRKRGMQYPRLLAGEYSIARLRGR